MFRDVIPMLLPGSAASNLLAATEDVYSEILLMKVPFSVAFSDSVVVSICFNTSVTFTLACFRKDI